MADFKISGLPSYTPTTLNDGDLFVVNDATNPSGQVTRSITAEKLGAAIAPGTGGNRLASYMSFFNDPGGNNPDGSNGLRLNVNSWWSDSPLYPGAAVPNGEETLSFQVPAKSIGAYIFFSARMDQNPSDGWENNYKNPDGVATMKTFMRCNLTTPEAYWNTRATGQFQNTNGFAMRLISTLPTGPGDFNEHFQTYHAAKWDTVEWNSISDQDRTFSMTVKWYVDRANWVNLKFGMNRVIVIPLYEDPQTDPSRSTASTTSAIDLVNSGTLPTEYQLKDANEVAQFDAVYTSLMGSQSSKDELRDRTRALKSSMDRLLERIQSYKAAGGSDSNNILQTAEAELTDIKNKAHVYISTDQLKILEINVNAQWTACAPLLDVTFGFESLLNTY